MATSLRDVEEIDLHRLRKWADRINSGQFMSRYMPRGDTFADARRDHALLWSVILAQGREVGVVWLEKEKGAQPSEAILGILLADTELFGHHGIGKEAIDLAIQRLRSIPHVTTVTLNVRESNTRAIACYRKCGFRVVSAGVKGEPGREFKYLTMERRGVADELNSRGDR